MKSFKMDNNTAGSFNNHDQLYLVCQPGIIDRGGKLIHITPEILKEIADSYSTEFHEAPLTLDHAQSGSAHGYVSKVVFENDSLFVAFNNLSDEIIALTSLGRYKKPSIEIAHYGKYYLRAVSLVPFPEIKGLPEIKLSEPSTNLDGSQPSAPTKNFFSHIPENVYISSNPSLEISLTKNNPNLMKSKIITLAESLNLQATDDIAAVENISAHIISLSEQITGLNTTIGDLNSQIASLKADSLAATKKANESLVDSLIAQGKALPASKESLIALAEANPESFMKLSETLPVLGIFQNGTINKSAPIIPGQPAPNNEVTIDGKIITYGDVLKDIKLSEKLSEEQLISLREKYTK